MSAKRDPANDGIGYPPLFANKHSIRHRISLSNSHRLKGQQILLSFDRTPPRETQHPPPPSPRRSHLKSMDFAHPCTRTGSSQCSGRHICKKWSPLPKYTASGAPSDSTSGGVANFWKACRKHSPRPPGGPSVSPFRRGFFALGRVSMQHSAWCFCSVLIEEPHIHETTTGSGFAIPMCPLSLESLGKIITPFGEGIRVAKLHRGIVAAIHAEPR